MEVTTGKHLLVDNFIVEDAWNLQRQTLRPAKHIDNPLLVPDQPWERTAMGGCYVLFDEQENIFRMWYHVFSYVAWKSDEENWYTYWTCYAESPDGITWHKPDLGIVEFVGVSQDKVARDGGITGDWHGRSGVWIAYSPDGIHWDWGWAVGTVRARTSTQAWS